MLKSQGAGRPFSLLFLAGLREAAAGPDWSFIIPPVTDATFHGAAFPKLSAGSWKAFQASIKWLVVPLCVVGEEFHWLGLVGVSTKSAAC